MSDINEARARLQRVMGYYQRLGLRSANVHCADLATVLAQPAGVAAGWSEAEKQKARRGLRDALIRGEIARPDKCERCGVDQRQCSDGRSYLQGHHHDYSLPLDVKWLCAKCHRADTPLPDVMGGPAFGSSNGASKLNEQDIPAILASPLSSRKLGAIMGVDHKTILRVRSGELWSHAAPPAPSPTLDEAAMGNRKNMIAPDPKRSGALVSDIPSEAAPVSVSAPDEASIRADERERCARVADAIVEDYDDREYGARCVAAAIRREGVTAVGERRQAATGSDTVEARKILGDMAYGAGLSRIAERIDAGDDVSMPASVALDAMLAHATPTPNVAADALSWVVGNGSGTRWRTWRDGFSAWTDDLAEATRYARRVDAEAVHREDEDAWTVVEYRQQQPGTSPASGEVG